MNFDFGTAAALYDEAVHPRILLSPEDLEHLRGRIRRGTGRQIAAQMEQSVGPVAQQIVDSDDLAKLMDFYRGGAWQSFAYRANRCMTSMALLGRLRDNPLYIEAVRRVLFCEAPPRDRGTMTGVGFGGQGAIAFDIIYEHLSNEDRARFETMLVETTTSCVTAARVGAYLRGAAGNIAINMNLISGWYALMAAWRTRGTRDLSEERDALMQMLEASLHAAIHPEGYPEEDPGYGSSVASALFLLAQAVTRAGWYDVLEACPRVPKFGRAMLHMLMPWGQHLSMIGDHAPTFPGADFCLPLLAQANGDGTLLWLLSQLGADGVLPPDVGRVRVRGVSTPASLWTLLLADQYRPAVPPARAKVPTAYCEPTRGLVSFRSGWDADDALVTFDGSHRSPSGQGHAHASCGHFAFSALGEYFGIDTGRYSIEQDQHNLVLIDGKSGRSTEGEWTHTRWPGRLTAYQPGPLCDYASADSSHQHNCYWAWRHLMFIKAPWIGGYLCTIEDINKHDDWAEFWWTLHTSPENRIRLARQHATIRGWRQGNLLDVHFALPGGYPKPHTLELMQDEVTPSSYKYLRNPHERAAEYARPADMVKGNVFVRPRLIAKVAGYNGRFLSLMVPRRKGDSRPQIRPLATLENALAVRIRWDDVQDTLIWAYEHNLLEAGDVRGRGQWCVVRQGVQTGKVLAWQLGAGSLLTVREQGRWRELR